MVILRGQICCVWSWCLSVSIFICCFFFFFLSIKYCILLQWNRHLSVHQCLPKCYTPSDASVPNYDRTLTRVQETKELLHESAPPNRSEYVVMERLKNKFAHQNQAIFLIFRRDSLFINSKHQENCTYILIHHHPTLHPHSKLIIPF